MTASQPSAWSTRVEHVDLAPLLLFAFRYALGRRSTAPSTVADLLARYGSVLSTPQRQSIVRDIDQAMAAGWAGDDCDREVWRKVAKKMGGSP